MRVVSPDHGDPLEQAAEWFSRRRSGTFTRTDDEALGAWLAASEGNAVAYREIERNWKMFGEVAQEPAILDARERDYRRYDRAGTWRRGLAASVAALLTMSAGWATYQSELLPYLGIGSPRAIQTFSNAVGQRSNVLLADGSTVTLDTNSEVRVLAMGATRTLELVRGRAFFAVAKDPMRPFLVRAAGRVIRATGTEFAVRLDHRDVAVTLVEGSVNVNQSAGLFRSARTTRMRAGTRLEAGSDGWTVSRFDPHEETSWLSGQLTFVHVPLATAVDEVNRYSAKRLEFEDGEAPRHEIVGVFHAGDVEGLARAIQLDGYAHIVSSDDHKIVMAEQ